MKRFHLIPLFFCLLIVSLAGCAAKRPPDLLTKARETFQRAEAAKAAEYAPQEFQEAKRTLEEAEQSYAHQDLEKETDHRSFVANARAEIALLSTQEAVNRKRIEEINRQKGDLISQRRQANDQLKSQQEMLMMKDREIALTEAQLRALNEEKSKMLAALTAALSEIARVQDTQRGLTVSLSNVLFETNSAELKAGNRQKLVQLANVLRQYPGHKLLIEGHTDSVGQDNYNLKLSENRARSVEELMMEAGIGRSQMDIRGYGKAFPVASNKTNAGRQQNRRVDILILNPYQTPVDSYLDKKG